MAHKQVKKVGIYSGTFDPVHNGHIGFAIEAIEQCGLDKVFFLVEPNPRRKQGVKAHEHRVRMVDLAIKKHKNLGQIILDQSRFTPLDTLPVIRERFKGAELYMLMGDDILSHFVDWPNVDHLLSEIKFCIGLRKFTKSEAAERINAIQKARGLKMDFDLFSTELPETSSSKIRMQIKRGQKPKSIDPAVLDYINQESLYASSKAAS